MQLDLIINETTVSTYLIFYSITKNILFKRYNNNISIFMIEKLNQTCQVNLGIIFYQWSTIICQHDL